MPVDISTALATGLHAVTKEWTAAKRHADRQQRISQQQLARLQRARAVRPLTIKEAAYQVMRRAYMAASAQGRLPANARQVMYAARAEILRLTDKEWGPRTDQYFTQHLLPDYIDAHPAETAGWDVVFDDRGHIMEPHTGERLGLGTIAVRDYRRRWTSGVVNATIQLDDILRRQVRVPTVGPRHRYGAVLFVEKEGFDSLWAAVNLADRFDLAIMSTKGMSVTASRQLVEQVSDAGVPIYVLHDFDKAGFSIVHTLRTNTRRYRYGRRPQVIDLGLRLADVEEMDLPAEPVEYSSNVDPRINLRDSGASEAEADFLVHSTGYRGIWVGERVELNAMPSDQLVEWLEAKLQAAGVCKLVPDTPTPQAAYRRAVTLARVRQAVAQTLETTAAETERPAAPEDLPQRVAELLNEDAARPWDEAIWKLAQSAADGAKNA
jgi:hypothetical protein